MRNIGLDEETRIGMLTRKCLELQDELWTSGWNNLTCEATVVYLETLVGKLRKLVREDLFHRHAVRSLAAVSKRYDETVLQNVVESASKDYGFRNWEWDEYYRCRCREQRRLPVRHGAAHDSLKLIVLCLFQPLRGLSSFLLKPPTSLLSGQYFLAGGGQHDGATHGQKRLANTVLGLNYL